MSNLYTNMEAEDFLNDADDKHHIEVSKDAALIIKNSKDPVYLLGMTLEICSWNVPTVDDVLNTLVIIGE